MRARSCGAVANARLRVIANAGTPVDLHGREFAGAIRERRNRQRARKRVVPYGLGAGIAMRSPFLHCRSKEA